MNQSINHTHFAFFIFCDYVSEYIEYWDHENHNNAKALIVEYNFVKLIK